MKPSVSQLEIVVLFFHHAADELTRFHYECLLEHNAHDPRVRIVPICFPEYAQQVLPNTHVPQHLNELRWNRSEQFHRFFHEGNPVLSDLDCLIWDWVLHGGVKADRIVLAEGDMLSKCGIREFYEPSFEFALSGSVPRVGLEQNRWWYWYQHSAPDFQDRIGDHVASLTPVCGIQFSWDLAVKMATLVQQNPDLWNDVHVEMAIGSLARSLGVDAQKTIVPPGTEPWEYINHAPGRLISAEWGIFHPVKSIQGLLPAPVPVAPSRFETPPTLSVITLWRPDWTPTQAAVLEYLLEETFPAGTQFIWTVEPDSSSAVHLEKAVLDPRLGDAAVEILEVTFTEGERDKHQVVAGLYNQAIPQAEAPLMLLIEDDVIAAPGTLAYLKQVWAQLPPSTSACMVAYRSRNRPGYVCAGSIATGYVPWSAVQAQLPTAFTARNVPWVGGGFTLYRTQLVKRSLPVVARPMGSWTKGWDVDLCEKIKSRRMDCQVITSLSAEHRFD